MVTQTEWRNCQKRRNEQTTKAEAAAAATTLKKNNAWIRKQPYKFASGGTNIIAILPTTRKKHLLSTIFVGS